MRQGEVLGVERRRRWSDEEKLAILARVGIAGRTVSDVAREEDLTRQHIYQWRRELRRKGMWPRSEEAVFLPVDLSPVPEPEVRAAAGPSVSTLEIVLRNGRRLLCNGPVEDCHLARLIRLVETA
ncbi:transposase [Defluviimonas sp. WL0024]|uniref:Transposase n=1 Tax=Albidovulum salinarum TaxID=2984153 RepID=A0ABT2X9L8_9RHOB|nr:transposase [Defluviimonas sp. WL0024]MCU9850653.1 transposase [Defluviimonas sp. WL0024]